MMEQYKENNEKELAMARIDQLEEEFQKLAEKNLVDAEYYALRHRIDAELSKIYDTFPELETWNDSR